MAAISQRTQTFGDRARGNLSETVALPPGGASLPSDVPRLYRVAFLFLLSTCLDIVCVYVCTYMHARLPARRLFVMRRTHRALSTRSISVPRLPARHNYFAKHRFATIAPTAGGDRTKSARACGTSEEEIFLTARCHRVRPTEITDEDSERSSTPVTVQEHAGGRSPLFAGTIVSD